MGIDRIRKNLRLDHIDAVSWCKEKILKRSKRFIVEVDIDGHKEAVKVHAYTVGISRA